MDKLNISITDLFKIFIAVFGIIGGGIAIGDRLYAPKSIEKQVQYMYNAFIAAAEAEARQANSKK